VKFPVEHRAYRTGSHVLPMHSGHFLPAYLATHLAKHLDKPLLWALDFFRLWTTLDSRERARAIEAATDVGLVRHLRWAISLATMIEATRLDETRSLAAVRDLTRALAGRGNSRRLVDLIALSASPRAAIAVLAGRIWPTAKRRDWRDAPAYFFHRAIRWIYRRVVLERPSPAPPSLEVISLAEPDTEDRLRDALQRGPVWVTPSDTGMEPAIPIFGRARIMSIGHNAPRPSDIVLAAAGEGRCVLRRVSASVNHQVQLHSDTELTEEEKQPISNLLGICDLVDVDGRRVSVLDRPHGSLGILRAIVRSRRMPRTAARRFFYALEIDALPRPVLDPALEFREVPPNDGMAKNERADHFAAAPGGGVESGHVVALTAGKPVYRVSYVRGDGDRLRGVPDGWRPRGRVVLLHDGYTEPAFRNRGIHSAALRWILDRERDAGVVQAVCVVHADNFVGQRTVTRLGFQCIGEID
jgi:GNAT superfamily N-acetyltransferase